MRLFFAVGLVMGLSLAFGCTPQYAEPKPETFKTEGKVVLKDGTPYTQGGTIEFAHETTKGGRSTAALKADGTFVLHTLTAQHRVPGALAGSHTVTIIAPTPDQNVRTIEIQQKYTIAPGENKLTIVIDE